MRLFVCLLLLQSTIDDAVYRMLQSKWGVMTSTLDGKEQQLNMDAYSKHAVPKLGELRAAEGDVNRETRETKQGDSEQECADPIELVGDSPTKGSNGCITGKRQKQQQQQQGLMQFFKRPKTN